MDCEALLKEYKELAAKTHIEAQILRPGQPYKVNIIVPEDLMRLKVVAKELVKNCKGHCNADISEWYDIEVDARN